MRRIVWAFVVSVLCLLPVEAPAQEQATGLKALMNYYQARGWEGVGRLNIGYGGMCTGALISEREVLTAAHCLYDSRTGKLVDPAQIKFLAGWRNGRASAQRGVRRAVVHPDYEFTGPGGELRVSNDVALLELDSPIVLHNIQPFDTAERPRKGAQVGVVSYAHDRADTPSLQEVCHVLARQRGSLILSCDVDFGSSGAPIFVEVDGIPRIVSVVSAKATVRGRRVSLGTSLEEPLADLRGILNGTIGVTEATAARTVRVGEPRVLNGGGGAKFLKP